MATVRPNANRNRVLVEGTDQDCRDYVEKNFPRVHVEPGNNYPDGPPPDAVVVLDNDSVEAYVNQEWVNV